MPPWVTFSVLLTLCLATSVFMAVYVPLNVKTKKSVIMAIQRGVLVSGAGSLGAWEATPVTPGLTTAVLSLDHGLVVGSDFQATAAHERIYGGVTLNGQTILVFQDTTTQTLIVRNAVDGTEWCRRIGVDPATSFLHVTGANTLLWLIGESERAPGQLLRLVAPGVTPEVWLTDVVRPRGVTSFPNNEWWVLDENALWQGSNAYTLPAGPGTLGLTAYRGLNLPELTLGDIISVDLNGPALVRWKDSAWEPVWDLSVTQVSALGTNDQGELLLGTHRGQVFVITPVT